MTTETGISVVIVLAVVVLLSLAVSALSLANYIITALSIYTLANRRNISNPWLAWLPFGSSWVLGAVTDCHDAQSGANRKWRVTLLVLEVISGIGIVAIIFMMIALVFTVGFVEEGNMVLTSSVIGIVIFCYVLYIASILAATAFGFCQMICLYKVFEVTVPQKAIKYILLSLLVPLASAVCLLKCKDSMLGIPVYQAESAE